MEKKKILVARAVFPAVLERLASHFEVQSNQDELNYSAPELAAALQDKDGLFSSPSVTIDGALLAACPRLKVISNMAVGYNNIDIAAASAAGIMVTNTPGVLDNATADFGWALLLATARRVTEASDWLRAGHWKKWGYDSFLGADVHGATLGIIGMGRIGAAIARRASGFDMRVIYHNRQPVADGMAPGAAWVSKQQLLAEADHVILTLPYSSATHHTIGAAELDAMKPSAILINLARGGIVDDAALIAALRAHRIAGAGLDVFENEPAYAPEFLSLPNVVLTPHIASATLSARRAMADCAADNLIAALHGQMPRHLVNPAVR
jgi:gluconate 2-dehydrogenase